MTEVRYDSINMKYLEKGESSFMVALVSWELTTNGEQKNFDDGVTLKLDFGNFHKFTKNQ